MRGDMPLNRADGGPRVGGTCGPRVDGLGSSVGAGSVGFSFLGVSGVLEAIAFAVALKDVNVVGEPVQECAGEPLGAEDLGPFIERQVRGDQDRAALVSLGEALEEELGAGFGERHEAEFVNDQQAVFCQLALEPQQTFFVPGLHQFVDQGSGGDEADGERCAGLRGATGATFLLTLAGRQAETKGDVGFAGA